MPATAAPSANTCDVSTTYSASIDMPAADVTPAKTCSATHVTATHVTATHVTTAHVTTAMASGIRLTHQAGNKQQTACNGSDCDYLLFHDCISLVTQIRHRPADLMRA